MSNYALIQSGDMVLVFWKWQRTYQHRCFHKTEAWSIQQRAPFWRHSEYETRGDPFYGANIEHCVFCVELNLGVKRRVAAGKLFLS